MLLFFSVRSELIVLHNAFALAQESAICNLTELHCCCQSSLDSCEAVVTLDTVARTPQSHERVLVVSWIEVSLLSKTIITLRGSPRNYNQSVCCSWARLWLGCAW